MQKNKDKKKGKKFESHVGSYLVTWEEKDLDHFHNFHWNKLVELYKTEGVKIKKIESIATEFYRPIDITESALNKLKEGVE